MQMKMRALVGCFVAAALVVGCAQDEGKKESKLSFEDLPVSVRLGVEKAYPDAHVQKVVKRVYTDKGIVHYDVKLITKDGVHQEAVFAPDGEKLPKE